MGFDNVNVNVSGPVQPTSTYKTKVLKGNHSFASQVTEPNMKYVIKHDFDLGGESVTIPENSILEFGGGSLNNGSIVGNNTLINGDVNILRNIDVTGSLANTIIYVDWFDSKTSIVTNILPAYVKVHNYIQQRGGNHTISFKQKEYHYNGQTSEVAIRGLEYVNIKNLTIEGNDTKIINDWSGTIGVDETYFSDESLFQFRSSSQGGCSNITIRNLNIIGNQNFVYDNHDGGSMGIALRAVEYVLIEHCKLSYWGTDGIYIGTGYGNNFYSAHITIRDCEINNCFRQGISVVGCDDDCTIDNCYIHDIEGGSFQHCIDIESNTKVVDGQTVPVVDQKNIKIINCTLENPARDCICFIRANDVIFENNYCKGLHANSSHNIWFGGSDNKNIIIRGNIIISGGVSIFCNHGNNSYILENNYIEHTYSGRGVYSRNDDQGVDNSTLKAVIRNNTIKNGGIFVNKSITQVYGNTIIGDTFTINSPNNPGGFFNNIINIGTLSFIMYGDVIGNEIRVSTLISGISKIDDASLLANNSFYYDSDTVVYLTTNIDRIFNNKLYGTGLVIRESSGMGSVGLKNGNETPHLPVDYGAEAIFRPGGITRYNKDNVLASDPAFSWFLSFNKKAAFFKDSNGDWFTIRANCIGTTAQVAGFKEIDNGLLHYNTENNNFRIWNGTQWLYPLLNPVTSVPTSASATGTKGEFFIDADYFYICVAANAWKRFALETW